MSVASYGGEWTAYGVRETFSNSIPGCREIYINAINYVHKYILTPTRMRRNQSRSHETRIEKMAILYLVDL